MAPASPIPIVVVDLDRGRAAGIVAQLTERGHSARSVESFADDGVAIVLCAADQLASCGFEPHHTVFGFGTRDQARPQPGASLAGYLVHPLAAATVASIVDGATTIPADHTELLSLSLLGEDADTALDRVVAVVGELFACNCLIVGGDDDLGQLRTAHPLGDSEAGLLSHCEIAIAAGAPTYVSLDGRRCTHTLLAVALTSPGETRLGELCLVAVGERDFLTGDRAVLAILAARLATELSWVSAHNRLVLANQQLRETALVDSLMDIWTRAAFEQLATSEIAAAERRGENLALALLDIDGISDINDRYGHVAGDAVLAHFARTVRANLRVSDLVGRYGDDELAIILPGVDLGVASNVVAKLLDKVAGAPIWQHGVRIEFTATAGLAAIDVKDQTGANAFASARTALADARTRGVGSATAATTVPDDVAGDDGDNRALPAGHTLGGMYRILHELNRGAMGVVYRAEDMGLGRPVAIKVLRSDLARDLDLVACFRREAATLAALHHPHLVQVYAFGTEGDDVYFVMELVEGQSLADVLYSIETTGDHLHLEIVSQIVEEIADALEEMRGVGMIHRDVKPANILLDEKNDRVVLVDVGVAKRSEDRGVAAGTPGFAAPESFTDEQETSATDVYGLAATMYMALTGLTPFGGGGVVEIVELQMAGPPPLPSQLRDELTDAIDQVLLKALAPEQADRYDSAATFAMALASALRRVPTTVKPPERRTPPATLTQPSITLQGQRVMALRGNQPLTRGAVFRVAYKLFSHHLGAGQVRRLGEENPELAEVLRANLSPTCWRPLDHLIMAIEQAVADQNRRNDLARILGRAVMTVTFARFFGAEPSSLKPFALLKASESCWSRYHTWGRLEVSAVDDTSCIVVVHDSPGNPIVCSLVAGSLARIAELSGAKGVEVEERKCDGGECQFHLRWDAVARPPAADTELPGVS